MKTSFTIFDTSFGTKTFTKTVTDDASIKTTTEYSQNAVNPPWDYVGFVLTGQSLGAGDHADAYVSRIQPFKNVRLQDSLENTFEGGGGTFSFVPLTEPIRPLPQYGQYDQSYPNNISGETPCAGFANQMASTLGWRCVAHNVAKPSAGIAAIKKNGTSNSYAASLSEIQAAYDLSVTEGRTYGVDSILLVHGEADSENSSYKDEIQQLREDYDADIKLITGQVNDVRMIISQQGTFPNNGMSKPLSALAAQELQEEDPEHFIVVPKYQFDFYKGYTSGGTFYPDNIHLTAASSRRLGEQMALARLKIAGGLKPSLKPISVAKDGNNIIIDFDVPVMPLQWTTTLSNPHQVISEWANGKGFEVMTSGNQKVTISSVTIQDSSVIVSCASDPGAGCKISYAMYQDSNSAKSGQPEGRHGLLCDSDSFESYSTQTLLSNVTQNYDHTTSVDHGGMHDRGALELVSGLDLPSGTFVKSITSSLDNGIMKYDVALNNQWSGATRTVMLTFKNDHRNYCIHFEKVIS